DRDARQRGVVLLREAERPAIHHRHHHVEQDQTRRWGAGPQPLECDGAVLGADRRKIVVGQDLLERLANVGVVVDDQHAATRCSGHGWLLALGNRTANVAPWPGSLVAEIVPPWASTMPFVM